MSSLQETTPKESQNQVEGEKVLVDNDNITQPKIETQEEQVTTQQTEQEDFSHLPENVRILKEAFPDTDIEVIEAILEIQGNSVDSAFEVLLGMSDPNYKSTPIPPQEEETTPPMPPRPTSFTENNATYSYWERQQQQQSRPISVEEQLRMDEEYAKKLAMEDEARSERRRMKQYQQQQQKREAENDDDSIFNLQEELPIIKEKMKEAGNAAKKKMMDFFNQIKANTGNPNHPNQHDTSSSSSMPTTNAQYRGLPSDDGDDLLTGDVSALHLSDYDVYAQTGGRQIRKSNDMKREDNNNTSTSNAQLKSDEDFARQLYQEEQLEARKISENSTLRTPQQQQQQQQQLRKSNTPTVVIAPRSPLEFEGDSDYEDVGLTATSTSNHHLNGNKAKETSIAEESSSVPYVIGDDDDSDSDDLVDIDEDDLLFDDDNEDEEEKDKNTKSTPSTTTTTTEEVKKDAYDNTTTTTMKPNEATTTTTTTNK